jgi:hypothetical protein
MIRMRFPASRSQWHTRSSLAWELKPKRRNRSSATEGFSSKN